MRRARASTTCRRESPPATARRGPVCRRTSPWPRRRGPSRGRSRWTRSRCAPARSAGQTPAAGASDGEGWTVDGEAFDGVVVASGLFARELEPRLRERDRFRGRIVHSGAYRDPKDFAGADVVVAGAGSSGADIAVELASIARTVAIAVRDVPTFTPRHHRGRPYDHRATRLARLLPVPLRRWSARRAIASEYRRRGLSLG